MVKKNLFYLNKFAIWHSYNMLKRMGKKNRFHKLFYWQFLLLVLSHSQSTPHNMYSRIFCQHGSFENKTSVKFHIPTSKRSITTKETQPTKYKKNPNCYVPPSVLSSSFTPKKPASPSLLQMMSKSWIHRIRCLVSMYPFFFLIFYYYSVCLLVVSLIKNESVEKIRPRHC